MQNILFPNMAYAIPIPADFSRTPFFILLNIMIILVGDPLTL
jgi:hypothetical protein